MKHPVYTAHGKQVLLGKEHIADAVSEEAAVMIADALNIPNWLDAQAEKHKASRATARAWRIAADSIRAGFHGDKE